MRTATVFWLLCGVYMLVSGIISENSATPRFVASGFAFLTATLLLWKGTKAKRNAGS
jgi:glucose dehydrogenase